MLCSRLIATFLFVLMQCVSLAAFATDHVIVVGGVAGNVFTPSDITIPAGDTVTFTKAAGAGVHNVESIPAGFHCSTSCGLSPTGDPTSSAWSYTHTYSSAGTFPYDCELHAISMRGTITVTPASPVTLQSFEVK